MYALSFTLYYVMLKRCAIETDTEGQAHMVHGIMWLCSGEQV
jgi:hypothetical protein